MVGERGVRGARWAEERELSLYVRVCVCVCARACVRVTEIKQAGQVARCHSYTCIEMVSGTQKYIYLPPHTPTHTLNSTLCDRVCNCKRKTYCASLRLWQVSSIQSRISGLLFQAGLQSDHSAIYKRKRVKKLMMTLMMERKTMRKRGGEE